MDRSKRECFGHWPVDAVCDTCGISRWCEDYTIEMTLGMWDTFRISREDDEAMWQEHIREEDPDVRHRRY